MLNSVNLIGRTTKEIEVKFSQSGNEYCNFTLAVTRNFKDKATNEYESDFIMCKAFGNTAKLLGSVSKGSLISISGNIQTGSYDKENGDRVYTTDVYVNQLGFLEKKSNTQKELSPYANQGIDDVFGDDSPF